MIILIIIIIIKKTIEQWHVYNNKHQRIYLLSAMAQG